MSDDADRKDRLQLAVVGLASLLLMSLVALLVVVLLWQTDKDDAGAAARAAVLADAGTSAEKAARTAVVSMTTYDYRSIEDDFAWVEEAGTAKFRKQYAEVSAPIKELVLQLQAHAEGTVIASAPKVVDADHVTVLLFVDQEISNPGSGSTGPQKGLDQPRVMVSMVRQDGHWLVDQVKLSSLSASGQG